jgi:polysaccharide export outer membrane protein
VNVTEPQYRAGRPSSHGSHVRYRSLLLLACLAGSCPALPAAAAEPAPGYRIQPGDQLAVTVWGEADLSVPVTVRPDGALSLPLVGDLPAAERSPPELAATIRERLLEFLPDPIVSVTVTRAEGNVVYVIGRVNRPGAFAMHRPLGVLQVLALAGGLDAFADAGDIRVLRRGEAGTEAFRFDFAAASRGRDLARDITLRAGDVIVVP